MQADKPSLKRINSLKYALIGGYAAIVLFAILGVSILALQACDRALKSKVSSLVSSLNVQMKLNMDSYLSRMETIGTLAFAAEETYTYDATNPDNDEYEALGIEKTISDKLYSLCIMDNFVDYGIIYRNNHTVGKISNGTKDLFGDSIYEELSSIVTRQRTRDGWAAGFHDNFKRIYYVKQIHENALLVISFYTAELENVFDNPQTMKDITIRLTNYDYNILYSSKGEEEIGMPLPTSILERVQGTPSATLLDDSQLVTVSTCGDSWYVVCSIPTHIILKEKTQIQVLVIAAAILAAILAAALGTVLSLRLTKPLEYIVLNLDSKAHTDQLTGILNKLSFEECTKNRLDTEIHTVPHALILVDVDNFKGVNDTLGHAYGDKVLSQIGSLLRGTFSNADFCGRIGGDEFCILLNTTPPDEQPYLDYVREKCEAVCEGFRRHYTGDDGTYKISASLGCSLFPEHGDDFATLYKAADTALYASKHRGKDTYTIAGEVSDHA